MKRRTDDDRRRSLMILNLRAEADRLERSRDCLRRELADEVRRRGGGWGTPVAVELTEKVQDLTSRWEGQIEVLRAALAEQWKEARQ